MPNIHFDFRRGAGSAPEILFGTVSIKATSYFQRGTSLVLPAPTTLDLVDGEATATNVAPSPAPVDGQVEWAYVVTAKDRHGKSFEWIVGVPFDTGTVEFASLPRYFETKPPLFGQGPQGVPGEAATIEVGSVTSGETPSVNNSGTSNDAVLDFVLPKGDKGDTGLGVPEGGTEGQTIQKTVGGTEWVDPSDTIPLADAGVDGLLEGVEQALLLRGKALGTRNLNTVLEPGRHHQFVVSNVTAANNYPLNGASCYLDNFRYSDSSERVIQELSYAANGRRFRRNTSNGGATWSVWVEYARKSDIDTAIGNIPLADADTAGILGAGVVPKIFGTEALGDRNLNDVVTPGKYYQNVITHVKTWNNYPINNSNTEIEVFPITSTLVGQTAYLPVQNRTMNRRQTSAEPTGWTEWREVGVMGYAPKYFSNEQRAYPIVLTNTTKVEKHPSFPLPTLVRNGNMMELSGILRSVDGSGATFTTICQLPPDALTFNGQGRWITQNASGGKTFVLYISPSGTVQILDFIGGAAGDTIRISANWSVAPASEYSFTRINSRMFEGTDYSRTVSDLGTWLSIICIHGGEVEPGTSEIGKAIRDQLNTSWYEWDFKTPTVLGDSAFNVSHEVNGDYRGCLFDDPGMVELVRGSRDCLAFHGAADGTESNGRPPGALTCVGGDNRAFREIIANHLNAAGFPALHDPSLFPTLAGTSFRSPHNQAQRLGVQLELSTTQRRDFFTGGDFSRANRGNTTPAFTAYRNAILSAITEYKSIYGE